LTEELLKEMSLMLDLLWAWKWFFWAHLTSLYTILPSLSPETMNCSKLVRVIAFTVFLLWTEFDCWNANLLFVFHSNISPFDVPVINLLPCFINRTANKGCYWRCHSSAMN
jgi:hypothetical protein